MNNPSWMAFSRSAVAAAVAIVVAAPALAQNTSSAVTGRVLDAAGKGVPAATVTVRHVESGSVTNVTTDAEGRYTARGLRVGGPYTITFSKGGVTDKRDDVFLALAEALTLDSVLGAPAANVITVTGSAVSSKFNSATVGAGTNLGSRELNSLASINRNLQDYARLDPRLSQTDKERGEISAAGQNTRYNSVTIDGVSISDSFGLESNNLPTKKQPISMDAIQSAQVNLSNYDVTQKGYTGANINAVTKSGTNELKGSVYYVFRNNDFAGQRFNRTNESYFAAPKFSESTTGFTLGGPIIKDKLFFFVNYEDFKSSRNTPAFGPVGSPLTNVQITQQMIADAQSVAKNTWGIDVGGLETPPGTALRVEETLAKLDWNISDSHRANLRYSKTDQTEPIFASFSATGLSLSSFNYNQVKTNESVVAQWFADWTDSFSTELKVSQRDYRSEPFAQNGTRLPTIALRFDGNLPSGATSTTSRFLNMGTERSRHFNQLETKTADVYAGATWNVGGHEVKGGVDYAKNDVFNAFLQDTNGNYTFRCENGTYTFAGTTTPVTVNCATADAATVAAVVMHNFRNGTPSSYSVQVGQPGKTINDGVANWTYGNTGVFLQDTWKVSKALSLNFGVRDDQESVPTKPIANTDAAAAMVPGNA
ncbi:MAG: carboxypeptidase regulatory-like domain-containing protein, partial [Rubrivivax sp.]